MPPKHSTKKAKRKSKKPTSGGGEVIAKNKFTLPFVRKIQGIPDGQFKAFFGKDAEYTEAFFAEHVWWWRNYDKYTHLEKNDPKGFEAVHDEDGLCLLFPEEADSSLLGMVLELGAECMFRYYETVELASRLQDFSFPWKPAWAYQYTSLSAHGNEYTKAILEDYEIWLEQPDEDLIREFMYEVKRLRKEHCVEARHSNAGRSRRLSKTISPRFSAIENIDRKLSLGVDIDNDVMAGVRKKLRDFEGIPITLLTSSTEQPSYVSFAECLIQ